MVLKNDWASDGGGMRYWTLNCGTRERYIKGRSTMALRSLYILFVVCVLLVGKQSLAVSCTTINVSPNVSLCLKYGWQPILGGKLTTLDAFASGGQLRDDTRLSFAANLYGMNNAVSAMVNVRRYPTQTISQADVLISTSTSERASAAVSGLDTALRETMKAGLSRRGIKILGWLGTTLDTLNGKIVFITTYRRLSASSNAVFVVRLVRYLNGPESFTLTLSRREDLGGSILKVINEIQKSVSIH
jgi:hypothetical protein